jgi:16S rRNA (guanine527-N7)-methyltransferase
MDFLLSSVDSFGIALDARQVERFSAYQDLLLSWNKRVNLTAAQTPEAIQTRHFADSLSCLLVTGDLSGQRLIDVGSGAGFPGLPLKICFPDLELTLLESVGKKADFLQAVVAELGLEDVAVINKRAEVLGQDPLHRQRYDWAAARAVAHLSPLLEYLLPFCRVGGHALAQKGSRALEELVEAADAIALLGGTSGRIAPITLSNESLAYLIVVDKIRDTPQRYPRRNGVPLKRPL